MSSPPLRRCWSCNELTPHSERYCQHCGADGWDPAQDPATVGQPIAVESESDSHKIHVAGGHAVSTGVVIIATILAFSFWTSVAFGVSLAASPPDQEYLGSGIYTDSEYFTSGRAWFCLIAAGVMTAITWAVADLVTPD